MACKECQNSNKSCGCSETALEIPEYEKEETVMESCGEMFYTSCIIHGQPSIIVNVNDSELEISQNERLDSVIQKILLALSGNIGGGENFKVTSYSENSISLSWNNDGTLTYNLLKEYNSETETIDVSNLSTYTFTNLAEGTYKFTLVNKTTSKKSITIKMTL